MRPTPGKEPNPNTQLTRRPKYSFHGTFRDLFVLNYGLKKFRKASYWSKIHGKLPLTLGITHVHGYCVTKCIPVAHRQGSPGSANLGRQPESCPLQAAVRYGGSIVSFA